MRVRTFAAILISLHLIHPSLGCGDGGGDTRDGGGGSDGGDSSADAVPGADAFVAPLDSKTIQWGPFAVGAGSEDTRCVTLRLGNSGIMRVSQIHNILGSTSHHFIVYRVADSVEQTTPYPCQPFAGTLDPTMGAPLMITQVSEETLTLPQGVAFSLADNQMIRLEMHYVNATDADVELQATSTFVPIADSEFSDEADFLFIGNPDVSIPANSQVTLGPSYFPMPSELAGINIFALTGHTHALGVDMNVATTTGPTGEDTVVYDPSPFLWDEPETTYHGAGFTVPPGGGLRFSCAWDNTTANTVGFGESASDEMCFFWAYYYPSKGAKVCVHTEQYGGQNLCCPGSALCQFISL